MRTEETYNPQDFASVMEYLYRTFGADVFRNAPRMYAIFCDLAPKLKPYGNIIRQLAERGILTALERDGAERSRAMMRARDCLENELLLGADRVAYFLGVLADLYGAEPLRQTFPGPVTAQPTTPGPVQRTVPGPVTVQRTVPDPRVPPMSGRSGRLTWELDAAGLLTISGHGDMEDFSQRAYHQSAAPWCVRQSALTALVIKDGVRGIGERAFFYCANLKRVTLPGSLRKIGYMSFRGCSGLQRIAIPDGVKEIGVSAFEGCAGLRDVQIPRGVGVIAGHAFAECRGLTRVTIPDSVRNIAYGAFRGCANLSRAYVPAGAIVDPDAFDFSAAVIRR